MRVRNTTLAVLALVGGIGLAIFNTAVIVSLVGSRTTAGTRIGLAEAIVPAVWTVPLVGALLCWGRCWVGVSSTSVIVRNPLRRYVLPIESVDRFLIRRSARVGGRVRVVERIDGTTIPCWGLPDGDEEAVARAELLNGRLHRAREAAGLPESSHRGVPLAPPMRNPRARKVRVVVGMITYATYIAVTILGLKHSFDARNAAAPKPPAADQATCAATVEVSDQYTRWVDQNQSSDTVQAFENLFLHDPPIGPAIARLRTVNARTHDPALRGSVGSMVAAFAADPRGSSWLDEEMNVVAACSSLGLPGA